MARIQADDVPYSYAAAYSIAAFISAAYILWLKNYV